jgi:hypothetical protein
MNRSLVILLIILLTGSSLFGQSQAMLKEVTGKVEMLRPGESWTAAQVGMQISLGTTISTGFNSTALLELANSILRVKPLTRLRLDQLLEQEGTVKTELFLRVGKVNAEIKTAASLKQDFKLRSPVSTAAVRGTGLAFGVYEVEVTDGTVYYFNLLDQRRTYGSGEGGDSEGYNPLQTGDQSKGNNSSVNPFTPGPGGARQTGLDGTLDVGLTGGIRIIIPPAEN